MIYKIRKKVVYAFNLIRKGEFANIWKAFVRRIKSEEVAYGFKRDLSLEYAKPRSLVKITTRVYEPEDGKFFTERQNDGRINDFDTCYVGITKDGTPCCHLWLIDASQNGKLKRAWGNNFPVISNDELLVENVYTVPKYRGMGIFPTVLDDIVGKSRELGAKYVISFGEASNINMSRSFVYAGFQPYVLRRKKWFLFNKSIKFEEIPEKEMVQFKQYTAAYRAKLVEKD